VLLRHLLPALLALTLFAGCGDDADVARAPAPAPAEVALALDFTPNAVHAPIYMAVDRGTDLAAGVKLRIRPPGEGPDALKLLAAGQVDFGLIDIHDLGLARQSGAEVVGVGALVQKPLAALVGDPSLKRPRDLEGKTVGVSGLPSDPAFLEAIVEADGGDPRTIRQVTIGFNAVASLLARKVDAVPVFWTAEGVALRERGRTTSEFRVEDYGAPAYPEVIVMTRPELVRDEPERVRRVLRALAAGVEATQADPAAASALVARAGNADPELTRAQLDAVLPLFGPPLRLDRAVLEDWAAFDARIGLLERAPDVGRTFAFGLAP
jgi:putative hydroxymethylpyrimidine transport system substrate-binding protein